MLWLRLSKFLKIVCDPFLLSALIKGVIAGVEHKSILRTLSLDYVVDVGANRGQFALIVRKVFPSAKIISFEPLNEAADAFQRIFSDDQDVELYPFALGKEKKTSIIHVTKDDDSSSLLPVSKKQTSIFPMAVEIETREVVILPLSDIIKSQIPAASLLKMDVQGFELDVLKGCEGVLQKFRYLYIECSFIELYEGQPLVSDIIAWLDGRGFHIQGIHNVYYQKDGTAVQADFLFFRE